MNRLGLYSEIQKKKSFLCVGLDPDFEKMPPHLPKTPDGVYTFCRGIINSTSDYCVSYKPNLAFFEAMGPAGLEVLKALVEEIPNEIFTIADAKRGDIGNTSTKYAKAFFEYFNFDAVTIAPYMGEDSIRPFLEFKDKWVILLGLTSNKGSRDFQHLVVDGKPLYMHVIEKAQEWGNPDQLMYVIGATHPTAFNDIRSIAKDYFFLVPGVGAQGGSLHEVAQNGMNDQCGLLVNSSRGILYVDQSEDFAKAAGQKAKELAEDMATYIS